MRRMQIAGIFFGVINVVFVLGFVALIAPGVDARPLYKTEFSGLYKKHYSEAPKCDICHIGAPKDKKWNKFGLAFHEELGGEDVKDVKDKNKIKTALKKVVKKDSQVEGKTYEDLIKEGKKPASAE